MQLETSVSLSALAKRGITSASAWANSHAETSKLASGVASLDTYLAGGLPYGALCEWGAPLGRGGREVVRAFIAAATSAVNDLDVLWVSNEQSGVVVYPPSWFAHGVNLTKIYFATCDKPVAELKPVFFSPLFKIIILDAPKKLTRDDLAFLARQARINAQIVIVIRDYLLSPERGNVWAKFRLNCWQLPSLSKRTFAMSAVRGLTTTRANIFLPEREVLR